MKKLLSMFLCLILLFSLLPLSAPARAAEIVDSGTCGAQGDNLTWTLDSDGVLTISGKGAMKEYDLGDAPWYAWNTSRIKQAVISDGVTSIGKAAFYNCRGLISISIPDSVITIGKSAFFYCSSLTSIAISDSVTSISSLAFSGCTSLTSITIPDSVTSIGSSAFSGCTSLTSISIPDSVTSIGSSAFSGCSSLTSISIPDSVTSIDYEAFSGCTSLTSITIPDSVTSIRGSAFSCCTSLTSISIPDSVTYIGSSTFSGCSSLTSIVLPSGLWGVYENTFQNCSKLKSIVIPESVSTLEGHAFDGCSSLAKAVVLGNVSTIEEYCFLNCSALKSVVLPASVSTIEIGAFRNCTALTDVYYTGAAEDWGEISISSYNTPLSSAVVHFPPIISAVTADKTNAAIGEAITWAVNLEGGYGTLRYAFRVYRNGSIAQKGIYSKSDTFTYTPTESGTFKVQVYVKDAYGTIISKMSSESVKVGAPVITTQPVAIDVDAGVAATFTVAASGTGLSYQWQYSKDGGTTWYNKTGATETSCTVAAKTSYDGFLYRCKVKNTVGTVYSDPAKLTVTAAKPVITTQPANLTVAVGATATFKIAASGTGLKYQWQYSKDGGTTWYNKSGATEASCTIEAKTSYDSFLYRCKVKNAGGTVYSGSAKLTVTASKPIITTQPANQTIAAGATATFKIAASGTGLKYQWQYSNDNSNTWHNKSGASSASYTLTAKASYDGMLYRCKVTNAGGSVYSYVVKLTVTAAAGPSISSIKADKTSANAGEKITWTAAASGGSGALQYYFALYKDGIKIKTRSYSTTNTFSYTPTEAGTYRVKVYVKDAEGVKVYKYSARLTVS